MKAIRVSILLTVAIVSATTVSCRNRTTTNGGTVSPPKPFVVAIPTYPGFAIPYLAKEKGYFGDAKVELKRMDDAAAINAGLIRGDIDACFTSVDSFVLAASQGVEAKAVLMSDESRGADGIVVKPQIKDVADLKGKKVRLADLKGNVVVISFWATWCAPCKKELKFLNELLKTKSKNGFRVIAISIDGPESAADIRTVIKRYRLSMPVIHDKEGAIIAVWNSKATVPFACFVTPRFARDKQGALPKASFFVFSSSGSLG